MSSIIRGDALALPLADETVDLVVTSPPYFGLRSYTDGGEHYPGQIGDEQAPAGYVENLVRATAEMERVLKPCGSIWVNLGDKYAQSGGGGAGSPDGRVRRGPRPPGRLPAGIRNKSLMGVPWRYAIRCIDDLGLVLRAEVVWSKPNGLPESVTDRVRRQHETWFHFTKQDRYYCNIDAIRTTHVTGRTKPRLADSPAMPWQRTGKFGGNLNERKNTGNPAGALPGSVWEIPTEPLNVPPELGVDHHAAFPMEWPRRIIRGWSPEGGTVLDPFGGTGTTALVADALGRNGIHVDMSADYNRIAHWRVNDPRQRAKAAGREYTPPVAQLEGQVAFSFGGVE